MFGEGRFNFMGMIKKLLAGMLGILMVFTGFRASSLAVNAEEVQAEQPRTVFSIDAGRKYFSEDQLKDIIDHAYVNGYTDVQILLGNDGLRFLLDDMSVTVGDKTYESEAVKAAVLDGNDKYAKDVHADGIPNTALTEAEMNRILDFAKERHINVIPVINSPGHMDAILYAMQTLGINKPQFSTSHRTVDLTNAEAVTFTQNLVGKYISYFGEKKVSDIFNLGTDEYANDASAGGWAKLQSTGNYRKLVDYVNKLAGDVKSAGMKPMCFNDGIYYNRRTDFGTFDKDIIISYWTAGWWGYDVAKPDFFVQKGHKILNTNDGWYYVVGNETQPEHGNGYTYDSAVKGIASKNFNDVPGGKNISTIGSMQCVWCDYPEEVYEDTKVFTLMDQFSKKHTDHMRKQNVKSIHVNWGDSFTIPEVLEEGHAVTEHATIKHRDDLLPLTEVTEVADLTAGKYLVKQGDYVTYSSKDKFNENPKALPMARVDVTNADCLKYLWNLTVEGDTRYLQDTKTNEYLNINGTNIAMFPDKKSVDFAKKDGGFSVSRMVESTRYYLNNYGKSNNKVAGWTGDDNTWKMLKASTGTELTPKHCGYFLFTAGDTTYSVKVTHAEHTFGEWETVTPATCATPGLKVRTCACGAREEQVIPATGVHTFGEWTDEKAATCTEKGVQARVCSVCGHKETRETEALGHDWAKDFTVDKESTCTEKGSKSHHCTRCDAKKDVTEIPATGHTFGEWTVTKEATCTEAGSRERKCTKCDAKETEEIKALGHDWAKDFTVDKEPTCTEKGSKSHHCTRCDAKKDVTEIPVVDHKFGDWVVVKEAGPGVEGLKERECSVCHKKETEVIPAEPITTPMATLTPATTEKPVEKPNKPSTPNKEEDKRPATGDARSAMPWAVVMAGAMIAGFVMKRK